MESFMSAPFDFIISYILPFLVALSVLVFVHEWGHYFVARRCGVKVENFSIGFGRELFGRTDKNGTRWKFSLIPLGGYVQMFGDTDPASAQHAQGVTEGEGAAKTVRPFTEAEKKVAFYAQPVGRRAAIVFAGPAINYIFAILILTGLYVIQGQPYTPPVAASILEGSPAERSGFQPDDRIVEANGMPIRRFEDLSGVTALNLAQEMEVKVQRFLGDGKWEEAPVTIRVTPEIIEDEDRFGFRHTRGRIGIVAPSQAMEMQPHNLLSGMGAAVSETYRISRDSLRALWQMIIGLRSPDELGGILRIGAYAGEFAQRGAVAFITFMALLSINLGLINLLPIPMLDGGHLTMYAMEKLRGRALSDTVQEYALRVGLVFLLGIMVFASWNDLVQLRVVDYVMKLVS